MTYPEQDTLSRRDLVINLGDGLTTDAQLTFPAVEGGPFPGVLLIHGSGPIDMDGYIPPSETVTGEPVKIYLHIAEYLSERGFAVLRYNKRAIGLTGVILNSGVWANVTFQDLKRDAETALGVLLQQSEVDSEDITIIGRSEGAVIAPRIAIETPKVKNIVLMGAAARNLHDILHFQTVERKIMMYEDIDSNNDGFLSIHEVLALQPILARALIENSTGRWRWKPVFDHNRDGYVSIKEELKPFYLRVFNYLTETEFQGKWYQSHFALDSHLDTIGKVSASVLILHGEKDAFNPVSEAFLLDQRLTDIGHPDHTLITYPGLGHSFYPVDGWLQPLGLTQDYVLSDLVTWLKDPSRSVHKP